MFDWINGLSDGQFTVLALLVAACVFFPGYYITLRVLNRYGRRAMPHLMALGGFCVIGIAVLLTIIAVRP